jgi:hypothetical protein
MVVKFPTEIRFDRFLSDMLPGWLLVPLLTLPFWNTIDSGKTGIIVAFLTLTVLWSPVVGFMLKAVSHFLLNRFVTEWLPIPAWKLYTRYDQKQYAEDIAEEVFGKVRPWDMR